ncbi:glycoside hydrolase family 76 protein [Lentzea sp. NPDC059081]|uniref:glycoside hydrolase family 76 protein n=1 Tax=Lentzea sp. NPDC059081 TaxID=3346719 RepID=UPI00368A1E0A
MTGRLARTVLAAAVVAATVVSSTATGAAEITPLSTNPDTALTAFNNAFLLSNGNQRYYKTSLSNGEKDYFWRQALEIQAVEDVYETTRGSATRDLVARLLDTFLQQNQGSGGLRDWNWNEYNDDLVWAGLAFVRGYKITGNTGYLDQAKYAFNRVHDRGRDGALGGGIWWSVEKKDKNALSNSPAVILGTLIYEVTNDRGYLDKAQAVYDWVWSTLLDRSTGGVHETITADGRLSGDQNVYAAGAFVSAAQALYRNNGRGSILDDARRTTDWVIRDRTSNGIMTNGTRDGTWQSEFARGIGELVRENNLWDSYYDWMKRNADAAWNTRRTDLNVSWNRWDAQTPRDDTKALESVGTVVMQAVTPAAKPAGSRNVLISQWSDKCVDVPGFAYRDGQRLNAWTCTNGENQSWQFVDGTLRMPGGLCMDVAGGSSANGTTVQLATCSGNGAQQFVLRPGGSLVNPQTGKCVEIKAWSTADGADLVLWECNNGTNQKWHRG